MVRTGNVARMTTNIIFGLSSDDEGKDTALRTQTKISGLGPGLRL